MIMIDQATKAVADDGRGGLTVDDVALTGESAPVHRTAEAVPPKRTRTAFS
jgi:hypothetical protein